MRGAWGGDPRRGRLDQSARGIRLAPSSRRLRLFNHRFLRLDLLTTPPRTRTAPAPLSLSPLRHAHALRGSEQWWCIDGDRRGHERRPDAAGGGGRRPRRGGPGGHLRRREAGQGGQGEGQEARRPVPSAVRRDGVRSDHDAEGEDGVEPVRDRQVHRGEAQDAPAAQLPQAAARAAQEARRRWQAHQGQELLQAAVHARPGRRGQAQADDQGRRREAQAQAEGRREDQDSRQAEGQGPGQDQGSSRQAEGQGPSQDQGSRQAEGQGPSQAGCQTQGSRQAQGQAGREDQGEGGCKAYQGRDRDQDEGDHSSVPGSPGEGSQDVDQGRAREEGGAVAGQEGCREEATHQADHAGEEGRRPSQEGASPEGQEVDLLLRLR